MIQATNLAYEFFREEEENQIKQDMKIKVLGEYIFCLSEHKTQLQQNYDIIFIDFPTLLFDYFLEEFEIDNLLDLNLMFIDDCQINIDDIFVDNFEKWVDLFRDNFLGDLKFILDNFEECRDGYIGFLNGNIE